MDWAPSITWRSSAVRSSAAWIWRSLSLAAVMGAIAVFTSQPLTLEGRLNDITGARAFSIASWEIVALGESVRRAAVPPPIPTDDASRVRLVREYFALVRELGVARRERDDEFERSPTTRDAALLARRQARVRELEARLAVGQPAVEQIISDQLETSLRELGLRPGLVALAADEGWPIPWVRIYPRVFFRFESLPLNMVVAPRDRVAIISGLLVDDALSPPEIEALEARVDEHGVSSLVMRIGGLGTYPSMIPYTDSLARDLDVIAHEWTHHYLALRPLGRSYFNNYQMRSINELVADIVGGEVGQHTFRTYYAEPTPPAAGGAASPPRPRADTSDFGTEMRRIRRHVEALLAEGKIEEAEGYMREQREVMNQLGFRVRRLNTAYLAFFGSYAGGAGPSENVVQKLRQRSPSLADFVRVMQNVDSPETLTRLAAG